MSPFMQSQPSSFLKSSDMEGLDVLPENSGEGQASLDPSATASGPGMNTLTSELYEPSVDPPQASPGGVAMTVSLEDDRGATRASTEQPLGSVADVWLAGLQAHSSKASAGSGKPQPRELAEAPEVDGDAAAPPEALEAKVETPRAQPGPLDLPPAPRQILTPRPSHESILAEDNVQSAPVYIPSGAPNEAPSIAALGGTQSAPPHLPTVVVPALPDPTLAQLGSGFPLPAGVPSASTLQPAVGTLSMTAAVGALPTMPGVGALPTIPAMSALPTTAGMGALPSMPAMSALPTMPATSALPAMGAAAPAYAGGMAELMQAQQQQQLASLYLQQQQQQLDQWDARVQALLAEQQAQAATRQALGAFQQQQQQLQLQAAALGALPQSLAAGIAPSGASLPAGAPLPGPTGVPASTQPLAAGAPKGLLPPSNLEATFLGSQGLSGFDSCLSSLSSAGAAQPPPLAAREVASATPDVVRVLVSASAELVAPLSEGGARPMTRLVETTRTRAREELLSRCLARVYPGAGSSQGTGAARSPCHSPQVHRAAAGKAIEPSSPSASSPSGPPLSPYTMRYRLPQDPSVLVDLLDDGDVAAMWEELEAEAGLAREDGLPPPKLQLELGLRPGFGAARPSDTETSEDASLFAREGADPLRESGGSAEGRTRVSLELDPLEAARRRRIVAARRATVQMVLPSEVWLTARLGGGQFGGMYRGRWRDCDVAVKVIDAVRVSMEGATPSAWQEFMLQCTDAQALRHPNLVEVYAFALPSEAEGSEGRASARTSYEEARSSHDSAVLSVAGDPEPGSLRVPCVLRGATASVVMEYVSGRSLGSALLRRDPNVVGRQHRVLYLTDAARALEYLHSKGLTHHDLRSSNVLLGWRGRRPVAKVCGFTIARHCPLGRERLLRLLREAEAGEARSADLLRSVVPWTAPEIVRAPDRAGPAVDVYAFGVIMWQVQTMRPPDPADAADTARRLLLSAEPVHPPLDPDAPELGPGYTALMADCWREDPDARPTFGKVVERLRRIAHAIKVEGDAAAQADLGL